MKDIYYLNQETLPRIPLPHDNNVSRITLDDQFLVFTLETEIEDKDDAIQYFKPGAKGLIIRYHLLDILTVYKEKHSPRHLSWLIPPRFIELDDRRLEKFIKRNHRMDLNYLYHYVEDCSIIIKLHSYDDSAEIMLEVRADYVEYDWVF